MENKKEYKETGRAEMDDKEQDKHNRGTVRWSIMYEGVVELREPIIVTGTAQTAIRRLSND